MLVLWQKHKSIIRKEVKERKSSTERLSTSVYIISTSIVILIWYTLLLF